MAKQATSIDPKVVLACLRKALKGPTQLQGDDSNSMFPKGAKGKPLVEWAISQGYLHTTKMPVAVAGKKKPVQVEHGVLTETGRKFIFDEENPKPILESLLPAVEKLGKIDTPKPEAIAQQVQQVSEELDKKVNQIFESQKSKLMSELEKKFSKLEEELVKSVGKIKEDLATNLGSSSTPQTQIDPKPVLDALNEALKRVEAPNIHQSSSPTNESTKPQLEQIEDAIMAQVSTQTESSLGIRFDTLWNSLKSRFPKLTRGQFHDALRNLNQIKIRLSGWSGVIDDMPNPELGFFISSKVMYYAHRLDIHG